MIRMARELGWVSCSILNLSIITLLLNYRSCSCDFSHGGARRRFEEKFLKTCSKYPFVERFISMLENPPDNYIIFVFHDGSKNGGLGDRLAGMTTATAFALRTNRTLLIAGDDPFKETFRPFHYHHLNYTDLLDTYNPRAKAQLQTEIGTKDYSWRDWEWAKWKQEYNKDQNVLHCVNPKPGKQICALDSGHQFGSSRVLRYYGNRCYMCRWNLKKSLLLQDDMKKYLGVDESTNMYEAAGCLLRLAVWPTDKLWATLDEALKPQFQEFYPDLGPTIKTEMQIGFHFRCGDSSFNMQDHKVGEGPPPNPECFYNPSIDWKGTNFADDHSNDSPVDIGQCGKSIIESFLVGNEGSYSGRRSLRLSKEHYSSSSSSSSSSGSNGSNIRNEKEPETLHLARRSINEGILAALHVGSAESTTNRYSTSSGNYHRRLEENAHVSGDSVPQNAIVEEKNEDEGSEVHEDADEDPDSEREQSEDGEDEPDLKEDEEEDPDVHFGKTEHDANPEVHSTSGAVASNSSDDAGEGAGNGNGDMGGGRGDTSLPGGGVLAYIASDNPHSSAQLNESLDWPFSIRAPRACHVDLQKSSHCTYGTTVHWFMLSLSDVIVMQGLVKPVDNSWYENSPETAHYSGLEQIAPASAFSRYAALYSLSPGVIRYGRECHQVNHTLLGLQSHGNWVCDPKRFY